MDKVILRRRVLRRAIDAVKGLRGIGFVHIEDIIELVKKEIPATGFIFRKASGSLKVMQH